MKLEGLSGPYRIIVADPPWHFKTYSHRGKTKGAVEHYKTMTLADIKKLPVAEYAAKDAALFLWVVQPMLPEAMDVLRAWDFEFKTVAFCWVKMRKTWDTFLHEPPKMGLGYHTRSGMEQCWLALRGRGYDKAPRGKDCKPHESNGVEQVIFAPLREHSRKPDEAMQRIERLTSYGNNQPRVELFARQTRNGWDSWGEERGKFSGV